MNGFLGLVVGLTAWQLVIEIILPLNVVAQEPLNSSTRHGLNILYIFFLLTGIFASNGFTNAIVFSVVYVAWTRKYLNINDWIYTLSFGISVLSFLLTLIFYLGFEARKLKGDFILSFTAVSVIQLLFNVVGIFLVGSLVTSRQGQNIFDITKRHRLGPVFELAKRLSLYPVVQVTTEVVRIVSLRVSPSDKRSVLASVGLCVGSCAPFGYMCVFLVMQKDAYVVARNLFCCCVERPIGLGASSANASIASRTRVLTLPTPEESHSISCSMSASASKPLPFASLRFVQDQEFVSFWAQSDAGIDLGDQDEVQLMMSIVKESEGEGDERSPESKGGHEPGRGKGAKESLAMQNM